VEGSEAGVGRGLGEMGIGRDKGASGGTIAAPDEGSGKLKAVGCAEGIGVQKSFRLVADFVAWSNFIPFFAQNGEPIQGDQSARRCQFSGAMEPSDSTMYLGGCGPPGHDIKALAQGSGARA